MRRLRAAAWWSAPLLSAPLLAGAGQADARPVAAAQAEQLVELINAYRAAPQVCQGRQSAPLPALTRQAALANVVATSGALLEAALERDGLAVARVEAIHVAGPLTAPAVMAAIGRPYCATLLRPEFSGVGVRQRGDNWQIVLVQPKPPSPMAALPDWRDTGTIILQAVNAARANGRQCGENYYPPAPALVWNAALGQAARAHSLDMARQRYFSHQGKDGRMVGERARQAGYQWRRIGENIAAGQESPELAMAAWLDSPGHCANLMQPTFTDMGAAYAQIGAARPGRVYWTQVFGAPR